MTVAEALERFAFEPNDPYANPVPDPDKARPMCPDGSSLEFDLHPREVNVVGDGILTGAGDVEGSGARSGQLLQHRESFFDESPWKLKFGKDSPDSGWKYMCTIHGPLMSGTVVVR